MNIGDKVRFLRGTESGVVTSIVDNQTVMVEIEDGFEIPVLRSELVFISKEETTYFKKKETPEYEKQAEKIKAAPAVIGWPEGIYVAFKPVNDKQMALHLINLTDQMVLFSFSEISGDNSKGIIAGRVLPKEHYKLFNLDSNDFDNWPVYRADIIYHSRTFEETPTPMSRQIKFKAGKFFKSRRKTPLIDADAYTFRLDDQGKKINVRELKETLQESSAKPGESQNYSSAQKPSASIDLHIEELSKDHATMSNSQMLDLQFDTFLQKFDQALSSGMDEITFIHGVGNGVLKNKIHKYLSGIDNIKYFKDTQRDKWGGYGATKVVFK
ncbi:Smr/MutS family protein [Marinigracilibium pacificum]|uniref:DNA mismatch repair protein MutS n=1 Tax=Marinigracilibium pacificum TaxID=2729599 RepID=A0A848JC00_9BACT|nr:Smr/MutS family protein [Marinigracilibium pacificum]NMM50532.1 DNA mismatch repair protein MutS [Marinigracilibium pacificum]